MMHQPIDWEDSYYMREKFQLFSCPYRMALIADYWKYYTMRILIL